MSPQDVTGRRDGWPAAAVDQLEQQLLEAVGPAPAEDAVVLAEAHRDPRRAAGSREDRDHRVGAAMRGRSLATRDALTGTHVGPGHDDLARVLVAQRVTHLIGVPHLCDTRCQVGGHGAVAGSRQLDGASDRLDRDVTLDDVYDPDVLDDVRRRVVPLVAGHPHLVAGERLPLRAQYRDHVHRHATRLRDQQKLGRPRPGTPQGIVHQHAMAGSGGGDESQPVVIQSRGRSPRGHHTRPFVTLVLSVPCANRSC